LASGGGVEKLRQIIANQGGDPKVVDDYSRLPTAPDRDTVTADRDGYVVAMRAESLGRAAVGLGAGRDRLDAAIDPAVGFTVLAPVGTPVKTGDGIIETHHRGGRGLEEARRLLTAAIAIADQPARARPLVLDRIHGVSQKTGKGVMATTAHGVTGELAYPPPQSQPYDSRDFMVLGGAAGAAAVCAAITPLARLPRFQAFTGLFVILGIAYAFSTNRRAIDRRTVAWGLGLQLVFALFGLKTDVGRRIFTALAAVIKRLLAFSFEGSSMVFGPLGSKEAWPDIMNRVLGPDGARWGVVFAFQVLPTIIFIAALFAILYYFGIMQFVVRAFAVMMRRVMRASGAESLNVAASIFMGQTEAPLTIRPFIPRMTESELMTIMTAGMAHISGGIMAAYILFGVKAEHLLTAVIMTAPGTLMMAKIFVPETQVPETMGTVKLEIERTDVNVIDAAGRGTCE